MDFTFLTEEQIWGDSALDAINRYGTKVAPTDLAVLLGSYTGKTRTSEGDFTCPSWSASSLVNVTQCVGYLGNKACYSPSIRYVSARPVLPPSQAFKIRPSVARVISGIRVVEYGEYPQTVTDETTGEQLENLLKSCSLRQTGKNYTLDSVYYTETYPEYELEGKRYIRVLGRADGNILVSGKKAKAGDIHWVEVQPIEWLVDKTGTMVAKKCLFSGIQFDEKEKYDGDFSKTFMKKYLDTYFAKEIEPLEKEASRDISLDLETPVQPKEPTARQKRYGISVSDEPMPVKDQLNFYIQNGMSFMLHGPSGVGKSQRVKEIDPDLTSITLCNGILPEDVIGKTIYPNGVETEGRGGIWVAPKWYADLCKKCTAEPDKQHVLFIDEVTNARETTQSLIYHIALEKSIAQGVGKLPDNAVVVLAGNSKEESGAAYNMPAPLFRRLSHIYLDLNIQDWLEWGSERSKKYPQDSERLNIHPLIASFVATNGMQVFYSEYDEENPENFALDPRKWEKVSDKIYANKGVMRREILQADIGPELAESLLAYAQNPPLSLEEVLEGTYQKEDIPTLPDACLALTLSLRYALPQQVGKVRQFIETQLGAENRAIFDSVWVGKDNVRALQIASLQRLGKGR